MAKLLHIDASPRGERSHSRKMAVIHPESRGEVAIAENGYFTQNQKIIDRESLVSWLFLIGSLMFLFDGFIELTESISVHTFMHIVASIVFTIASVLFIPTDRN